MSKYGPNMESQLVLLRLNANISQKELAEALGVSGQTVRNWERGHSEATFTLSQIKTLCFVLGVSVEDLPDGTKKAEAQT